MVYDGDSLVVAADGTLLARAPQWAATLLVADLDLDGTPGAAGTFLGMTVERQLVSDRPVPAYRAVAAPVAERLPDEAEVWGALVTGLRDYVRKNGFRSVLLGMSGGIDSSVVAAVACDALGPDRVH